MIGKLMTCDVHRVVAAETYPGGYDATVARNVREQEANTIAEGLAMRGEENRDAGPDIESWLRRAGLIES